MNSWIPLYLLAEDESLVIYNEMPWRIWALNQDYIGSKGTEIIPMVILRNVFASWLARLETDIKKQSEYCK
jgi:hypothetical protein